MVNFNEMLKQAQSMQEKLLEAQKKIEQHELEGNSGGGMVKVTVSGKGDLKKIIIDPTLVVPNEVEVLEDLIVAAFKDGKEKADAYSAEEMSKIGAGMKLPGDLKLPF